MRFLGHPIHVMLIHFPVGLWPAHAALHLFASALPAEMSVIAFWLLTGGTALAWLAVICGVADLIPILGAADRRQSRTALIHGAINGSVTAGFTGLFAAEYASYPAIHHGRPFMAAEIALLVALFAGNYFGGALVWADNTTSAAGRPSSG